MMTDMTPEQPAEPGQPAEHEQPAEREVAVDEEQYGDKSWPPKSLETK
jgi:hypothetical protein